MAVVVLVQRFLCLSSLMSDVLFQWRFHLVQIERHIPLTVLHVLLQCVVSVYDKVV